MNNPKCTHNFQIPCEECGHFWADSGDHPVCHNGSNDGYMPGNAALVHESEVGVTYCKSCGTVIRSDGWGNFPDNCPGCGGSLDWSEWEENDAPSSTAGDYSPSNPWDAPGMSVRDFI